MIKVTAALSTVSDFKNNNKHFIENEQEQQQWKQQDNIIHDNKDSFSMLTDFMADKFANVDDKMDMFQKAQAGTRQQISELHSMLNELLFRERSQI